MVVATCIDLTILIVIRLCKYLVFVCVHVYSPTSDIGILVI